MPHSFRNAENTAGAFSTGPDGLQAELIYIGESESLADFDVKGKIVLADVVLGDFDFAPDG